MRRTKHCLRIRSASSNRVCATGAFVFMVFFLSACQTMETKEAADIVFLKSVLIGQKHVKAPPGDPAYAPRPSLVIPSSVGLPPPQEETSLTSQGEDEVEEKKAMAVAPDPDLFGSVIRPQPLSQAQFTHLTQEAKARSAYALSEDINDERSIGGAKLRPDALATPEEMKKKGQKNLSSEERLKEIQQRTSLIDPPEPYSRPSDQARIPEDAELKEDQKWWVFWREETPPSRKGPGG